MNVLNDDLWQRATGAELLPDPDDVVVPDLPEAIVAYRQWGINPSGELVSPMFASPWPADGPLEARCGDPVVRLAGDVDGGGVQTSVIRYSREVIDEYYGLLRRIVLNTARRHSPPTEPHVRVHQIPCPPLTGGPSLWGRAAGHQGKGCGIYGVRTAEEVCDRFNAFDDGALVAGEVWLSGQVLEYSEGYRASRGTPKALWRPHNHRLLPLTELAAERYGIPIIDGPPPPPPLFPPFIFNQFAITPWQAQAIKGAWQMQVAFKAGPWVISAPALHGPPAPTRRTLRRSARQRIAARLRRPVGRHLTEVARLQILRARAMRWAGGVGAVTVLQLAAWRRGDLLWWTPARLLTAATAALALAFTVLAHRITIRLKIHEEDDG